MCAAALAVLDVLEEEELASRADAVGAPFGEVATRGSGLCWEIDLPGGKRLLLRPPLTISEEDVRALLRELTPAR
jgi:4-aminobutyrate aminotransferase-like enzyme